MATYFRQKACFVLVIFALTSCKDSKFKGSGNQQPADPGPANQAANPGSPSSPVVTATQPQGAIDVSNSGSAQIPQPCTSANITFAGPGQSCAANAAAYTADDGNAALLGCCPLPATDILTSDPAQQRQGQCGADEVATGVVSGRTLLCTKINTTRYKLGPATKTCYNGSGASGGNGSTKCGAPPATLQAMVAKFGSDACIGFPFGQLIVTNTGANCGDISAAPLMLLDGTLVKMF